MSMQRRQLLKSSAAVLTVTAAGGAAWWLNIDHQHPHLRLDSLRQRLQAAEAKGFTKQGGWNAAQVFNHCAQSIEFSMIGFPQLNSALFQNTAGSLAFSVFSARGAMSHSLTEPIPGAPALDAAADTSLAYARMLAAIDRFSNYQGTLQPHFAFGTLNKEDYLQAHVLHINNHLEEFTV